MQSSALEFLGMQPSALECLGTVDKLWIVLHGHTKWPTVLNYVVFLIVGVRMDIRIILLIIIHYLIADLPTHGSPTCLFYSSPICVVPMIPILFSSPRVLLKCSEQLVECLLIQPSATNTIMMLIGAPV
jgi:hypothetical protein